MAITIQTDGEGVLLSLDENGRAELLDLIRGLEPGENPDSHDHAHLFSEVWGARGLEVLKLDAAAGQSSAHHLKRPFLPSGQPNWQNLTSPRRHCNSLTSATAP